MINGKIRKKMMVVMGLFTCESGWLLVRKGTVYQATWGWNVRG